MGPGLISLTLHVNAINVCYVLILKSTMPNAQLFEKNVFDSEMMREI